ncbi:hypothetical protein AAC387_Pa01g2856 [Persea americana]
MTCALSIPRAAEVKQRISGSALSTLTKFSKVQDQMASSSSSQPSLLFLPLVLLFLSSSCEQIPFKVVDLVNPVLHFQPHPILGHASQGAEDIISCERIRVFGLSRSNIRSYANAFRVTLKPSDAIPERLYGKIEVCFHGNASIGLCQCEKDEWKTVPKQLWSTVMSPYQDRYIDVKLVDGLSGSITVSVEEEFQQWRLFCLGFGFVLLLLAPIISSWVPFYYSSSMALGVLLVILILLFQGMKLLPTGRKSVFYLTIYGSVLGAGSFFLHYFSMLVNSVLVNFGLSEDMYNPVSVFVLLGIILAGAALGYWVVRKFVLSEDGSVDVGIAQFVMWAMRIVAAVFIFQSSLDTLYATVVFFTCWAICSLITSMKRQRQPSMQLAHSVKGNMWQRKSGYKSPNHKRAEFLRSAKMGSEKTAWGSPKSPYVWSNSPTKGLVVLSPDKGVTDQDYYSTFHKTPGRKQFSKKEWKEFTRESTRQAMAEWASSPEFTDWIIDHADRIQLMPGESSDDSIASVSDSSDENIAGETGSALSFFRWC